MKNFVHYLFNSAVSLFRKLSVIKRPKWFLWHVFPKDGEPAQSLFEIAIYSLVLYFCYSLFIDFNKIQHNNIIIEAEKLNQYRYFTKNNNDSTSIYLHYERADLQLQLPMNSYKSQSDIGGGRFSGSIYDDSLKINLNEKSNTYYVVDKLNPFWRNIAENAVVHDSNVFNGKTLSIIYKEKDEYIDSHFPSFVDYNERIEWIYKKSQGYPIPKKYQMQNFYSYKIATNVIDNNTPKFKTGWDMSCKPMTFLSDTTGFSSELKSYECYRFYASKQKLELLNNENYLITETHTSNTITKEQADEFTKKYYEEKGDKSNVIPLVFDVEINSNEKKHKLVSTDTPGYLERHDISQGWYHIKLNSKTIDFINLTINFVGATEFYPIKITPDEIGSNYIKYTNTKKILQIKNEGLDFYAQFNEMGNLQTIRCFALTALMSGLVILILAFIILSIYRILIIIGNSIFGREK